MTIADYLVSILKENDVADVFGIPGGVVLDFLYALDNAEEITPYLSYHEQAAAFEAVGYAQVKHTLGVAYATRGPGFTNLITGIADAYADSVPVLFITGHGGKAIRDHKMRFEKEQELDTVSMVKYITKYADVIEEATDSWKIKKALEVAMTGRKGPVMLDFSSDVWCKEAVVDHPIDEDEAYRTADKDLSQIQELIKSSKRPVFLLGDGIRQSGTCENVQALINKVKIPVISSRGSQDVVGGKYYFGYIGSHGIRYANMIFDKADLVIALGNRLAFAITSETYVKSIDGKVFVQIEIDKSEIKTAIPGLRSFNIDLRYAINKLTSFEYKDYSEWMGICEIIKNELETSDCNRIVDEIGEKLKTVSTDTTIVCDVGNNEFWTSRAYEMTGIKNRILYSKSFGTLGCGLPKAIGVAIKTEKPVLAIIGDQGLQLNIQELQFIRQYALPIEILVINNTSSGMIQDRQKNRYGYEVHTTKESGYQALDIERIVKAYEFGTNDGSLPYITSINVADYIALEPSIPRGRNMCEMSPEIDIGLLNKLKSL